MKSLPSSVWFMGTLLAGALFIGLLVISADKNIRDDITLPITVEEFFDYQCSHCAGSHNELLILKAKFGEDVEIIPRHYPIPSGPASISLAYGAEAARKQEMFEEFHNLAMAQMEKFFTGEIPEEDIDPLMLAEELELNLEQFIADMADPAVQQHVSNDQALGSDYGITGTPSFFVEGQKVSLLDLEDRVADLIEAAKANTSETESDS